MSDTPKYDPKDRAKSGVSEEQLEAAARRMWKMDGNDDPSEESFEVERLNEINEMSLWASALVPVGFRITKDEITPTYIPKDFPDYLHDEIKISIRRAALRRIWGHVNSYICRNCGTQLVTTDLDEGTTPYITRCRSPYCEGGEAYSGMYRMSPQMKKDPTHGWYRPTSLTGEEPPELEKHLRNGGLILRELTPEERS